VDLGVRGFTDANGIGYSDAIPPPRSAGSAVARILLRTRWGEHRSGRPGWPYQPAQSHGEHNGAVQLSFVASSPIGELC
jgi:hypothetical protein